MNNYIKMIVLGGIMVLGSLVFQLYNNDLGNIMLMFGLIILLGGYYFSNNHKKGE